MVETQRRLRPLALVLIALVLGAVVCATLCHVPGRGRSPAVALAGDLPSVDARAARAAAACYTIDTSRPEWLGGWCYLPVVCREE